MMLENKALFESVPDYLSELFSRHIYPWQILPEIKEYSKQLIEKGIDGYTLISPDVLVGKDVKIAPTATIEGPCIIGDGTEIRPGAYIRGSVITGCGCVIGNSTELKNCILLDKVQVPHYNYVGDSVLGNYSHMGAGSICSNLKSGGSHVVIHGDTDIDTGLRKIGGILADGADIGCGCVLNPGTVVGKGTRVYPLVCLRGVIDENKIVKSADNIVEKL